MVAGRGRSFGIVIATFGIYQWRQRGEELADNLEKISGADEVVHCHAETLSEARNTGAAKCTADWLTFVDADDTIELDFITAMREAAEPNRLLQPATIGCSQEGVFDDAPCLIPQANLYLRNYLIIATTMEKVAFDKVGGFRELEVLEDWDLFIRLIIAGYSVKRVPDAVYQVNVNPRGRNMDSVAAGRIVRQLRKDYRQHEQILAHHAIY